MIGLNAGSGQRPFDRELGWINLDINPKCKPDIVADWRDLSTYLSGSFDCVVSHHSLEHVGCGEGAGFIKEAYRILRPGGSLLVFVPDLQALAQRWLTGQLDTQVYLTNIYGPYDGTPGSRHAWGFDSSHLRSFLTAEVKWFEVKRFNWRQIPGADIARDWHILGMECVK